jgi:hypothetical protein
MKLALELLYDEATRLQQEISTTGDATGIYSDKWDKVNSAIIELSLLIN